MKNSFIKVNLLLIIFFLVTPVVSANTINIPAQVQVKSLEINLVDIAQLEGDSNFKELLKEVTLGQAPLPGYQRTVYRDEVIYALKDKGVNFQSIDLRVPYQFTVVTDYKKLATTKLINKGKDYIYNSLFYDRKKINIEVMNPPEEVMIPYGNLRLDIGTSLHKNLIGTITVPTEIIIDNKLYKRIYIQYRVSLLKKVLVAKKDIQRGERLSLDMFTVEEKLLTNSNNQFFAVDEDLSGKRMKFNLRIGRPLLKRMVAEESLVKRWEEVTIIARVGGVEVMASGKAREDGQEGEIIQVQNKKSGKILEAKVIAKNTVEVLID